MIDDLTGERQPQILTVRSSAGSGKTYRLAQHYLKVLLTSALYDSTLPTRMANIVAITFTNKAAQEMRSRIIDWMKRIILDIPFENSSEKPLDTIMRDITTVLPDTGEARDAGRTQKVRDYLTTAMDRRFSELLNEFSHFNVGTIDSFVNLTLKASAMQLNLPPDFDVTTETGKLMDLVLEECLARAGEDKKTRAILDRFVDSYIDLESNRTAWVPKSTLASMLTALWSEETRENKEFIAPPDTVYETYQSLRSEIADTARRLLDSFKSNSTLSPVSYVTDALDKSLTDPLATSKYFNRDLEDCLTKKSGPPDARDALLWHNLRVMRRSYAEAMSLLKSLPFLEMFGLFKHIFATEIIPRRRVVPIEELNRLLQNIMNRTDFIPEIYYTLSEHYLHFLIDEFQDTSLLQWKNIEVLADEALSRGGSLFLVGDRKQAIYRWRGGRPELVDDVAGRYENVYRTAKLDLDTNYRSGEHITVFNNRVFDKNNLARLAASILKDHSEHDIETVITPYDNAAQKFLDTKKGKGYVSVEFVTGEDGENEDADSPAQEESAAAIEKRIRAIVTELTGRGTFSGRDIAFLVRTREEAKTVVEILLSMDMNVESEYTVSVKNNPLVREIVSLLAFTDKPDDNLSFASFITGKIFREKAGIELSTITNWLSKKRLSDPSGLLYLKFKNDFTDLYENEFARLLDRSGYLPLYDLTVDIVRRWDIMARFPDDAPYILHLLEVIKDLEGEGVNTIDGLAELMAGNARGAWRGTRDDDRKWLLSGFDSLNAIKVFTIHKAKGLQFPVVVLPFISLMPFSSFSGADKQRFFEPDGEGLKMFHLKKEYRDASSELAGMYRRKEREYLSDELNNLYVAMTRAEEELYVLITRKKRKTNYLKDYLFHIPEFEPFIAADSIALGSKKPSGHEKTPLAQSGAPAEFGDFATRPDRAVRTRIGTFDAAGPDRHTLTARKKGDAVHRALSLIDTAPIDKDRIASICRIASSLEHVPEMAGDIAGSVRRFFDNPLFCRFFEPKPDVVIHNEAEVVDTAGNTFKIDRIHVHPGMIEVIDYKTGQVRSPAHAEQVAHYGRLLSDIYPGREIKKYILYIDSGEVLEI